MKKIIIGVGAIVIILITIVLKHEDIYETYKINQIRNDLKNNFNGKFNSRTYPYTIKDYELYHKSVEELNHYDITGFIETYIKMAEESINIYKEKEAGIEKKFEYKWNYDNTKEKLEYGKDIKIYAYDFANYISYDITNEDILNYENGTFTDKLIEKLKTCLDYEEKDGKIQWQINDIVDRTIELPYNCYIEYKAYHREDNKDFKKVVDVDLGKSFKLKKKESKATVKYETLSGNIKEKKVRVYYILLDDKEYYDISLYNILTTKVDTLAEAELRNHTCDRLNKEWGLKFQEEMNKISDWYDDIP